MSTEHLTEIYFGEKAVVIEDAAWIACMCIILRGEHMHICLTTVDCGDFFLIFLLHFWLICILFAAILTYRVILYNPLFNFF